MRDYELGIRAKRNKTLNEKFVAEHRDAIIWQLVCEYLGEHAGMQDALTLWTAFKAKKKVKISATGEEVYILSIQSFIEWDTHKVQTRYVVCRRREGDEVDTVCQQGDLEVIK